MKTSLILTAAALACGMAFAQAPAGVNAKPANQQDPNMSGGKAQATAEMNKKSATGVAPTTGTTSTAGSPPAAGTSTSASTSTATMGNSAMDTNGDGMISRAEWNAYHGKTWGSMKANKQGMVPWADVEAKMKGGPN